VNWIPHDDYEYGCRLSLDGLMVELLYQPTLAGPDRVRVRVRVNELDPTTGEKLAVAELSAEDDEDDENWNLFFGLYQAASKEAYHWDRVLGELESAVNTTGRIGLTTDHPVPATR